MTSCKRAVCPAQSPDQFLDRNSSRFWSKRPSSDSSSFETSNLFAFLQFLEIKFKFCCFFSNEFFLPISIRREKRDIPFIVTSCIREVERRGMLEVGIYRVSGSASDLARLKKAFESSEQSMWLCCVEIMKISYLLIISILQINFQIITKPNKC